MAEFSYEEGRIFVMNGDEVAAEILFPATDGVADINKTFVGDSLRGQGMAGQLVQRAADEIRRKGLKTKTTCSYAKGWFEKHPEQSDILA